MPSISSNPLSVHQAATGRLENKGVQQSADSGPAEDALSPVLDAWVHADSVSDQERESRWTASQKILAWRDANKASLLVSRAPLDLSGLELSELPAELPGLEQLGVLDLAGNKFTTLPAVIKQLTQLRKLNLAENEQLSDLPSETVSALKHLESLDLPGLDVLNESSKQTLYGLNARCRIHTGDQFHPPWDVWDHWIQKETMAQRGGVYKELRELSKNPSEAFKLGQRGEEAWKEEIGAHLSVVLPAFPDRADGTTPIGNNNGPMAATVINTINKAAPDVLRVNISAGFVATGATHEINLLKLRPPALGAPMPEITIRVKPNPQVKCVQVLAPSHINIKFQLDGHGDPKATDLRVTHYANGSPEKTVDHTFAPD